MIIRQTRQTCAEATAAMSVAATKVREVCALRRVHCRFSAEHALGNGIHRNSLKFPLGIGFVCLVYFVVENIFPLALHGILKYL
jgi:chromosome condensin MukBEF complex kleisin-like MukF subunit